MTELFPYLLRGYAGMLIWVGLDKTKAPDNHIPNFSSRFCAVNWAKCHELLPKDALEKTIQVREK
jgi:hypothetical protein